MSPRRRVDPDALATLDRDRIPDHVAIIMDGNGRWARRRGRPRTFGHAAGEKALFDTVEGALEIGLPWMTVYAFSTENWSRPPAEVRFIMHFNRDLLLRRADQLHVRGVRVRFLGRHTEPIPGRLREMMRRTEQRTARNRRMTLQIAFNYGARAELVDATRRIARLVEQGRLQPDEIDEGLVQRALYAPDAPDIDLLIRTSGEQRISNFMLWQAAYAELAFTDTLWPDFRREHLFEAIAAYQSRTRRFGGL